MCAMIEGSIADKFSSGKTVFSVEFYPPKTEEGARQILRTAKKLKDTASPDYVSITYGAGGSTRELTVDYGELLSDIFGFEVMPHLACLGNSRADIEAILERFKRSGFRSVMALRGDPPKNAVGFSPAPDGFSHANELVEFVRQKFPDASIGCAGYPEKHPEAESLEADIANLKRKVDAGADFVVTQMFFDNSHYFNFVRKCREAGIEKPIVAAVLPALSYKQVMNFKSMCSSEIPEKLAEELLSAGDDAELAAQIGIRWARAQIDELLSAGVPGIHLYILNRAQSALALYGAIRGS